MSRRNNILLAFFGVVLTLVPVSVSASVINNNQSQATVEKDRTIDDDLYITGQTVVVEGTVNGDVYAAGNSVTIRGTVNGDVLAAGQDVLVGGTVSGSVRTAGSTVRYSGANISGSATGFSSTFTVDSDSRIGGGLNFGAASATVRGPVERGIIGGASAVVLSNTVGKDVSLGSQNIKLERSAVINGGLNYYGESKLDKDSAAQVKGETRHIVDQPKQDDGRRSILGIVWGIASLFLVGSVLLLLFPSLVKGIGAAIADKPGASAGIGALLLLLALPAFLILLITVIGIPLALILGILFVITIYLSKFFVALAAGNAIASRTSWNPNAYADAFIGILLISLLELIPGVGWLIKLIVLLLGVGGAAVWLWHRRRPDGDDKAKDKSAKSTPAPAKQ